MYKDVVQLKKQSFFHQTTFLGIGPMSLNCINAVIELAQIYPLPFMLIASRRQIDAETFGGGYVNQWTTQQFCDYVKHHDTYQRILLARDHGGPWQNEVEVQQNLNLSEAMQSAKDSYAADIQAGIHILHIDPGRTATTEAMISIPEFIERTQELILFCYETAAYYGRNIALEIGTDEGKIGVASFIETETILTSVLDFCKQHDLKPPIFMVVQTGTKVMEMKQVGILEQKIRQYPTMQHHPELSKLIALCQQHHILLKEHNADYLSDQALQWHAQVGIDCANVAPEFGVIETKAFLDFLKTYRLHHLHERMLELALASGKWKKWMLHPTQATDYERALIAGHYIYSTPAFHVLKQEAQITAHKKGLALDMILKNAVKAGICRYLKAFRLISHTAQPVHLPEAISI